MSQGKQSRQGQAERRQMIIDYIRDHGPVKSGQLCKDLNMSRSSLSDDINAINAVSEIIECPKRGYYVCRKETSESPELRGMIDAEHVRRWIILYLLTQKELTFVNVQEALRNLGIVCSESTLHNSLRVMKEDRMITSVRIGNQEIYQASMKVVSTDQRQIKKYVDSSKNQSSSRVFISSYNTIDQKLAHIAPTANIRPLSNRAIRSSGKRNILSEEQILQLSDLERFHFRDNALNITFRTSKNEPANVVFRTGMVIYSVETNRIYLIGKNDLDYYTVIPLDSIDFKLLSPAYKGDKLILNFIYNTQEFTKMKHEMLNISTEKAVAVKVRFSRLRSVENRVKRFQEVRKADRNPAVFEPNEDGSEMIYTDCIRGLGDFSRFIRRFGRAAIVESPPELRARIIESSKKVISLYEGAPENE